MIRRWSCAFALLAVLVLELPAQQATGNVPINVVPPLVKFGGVLVDGDGKPLTGTVGVTFSLYKDQQGGASLWVETQNVRPDGSGRYTVMLGSASGHGLPAYLFADGEPRWVGVQAEGQAEQARIMLASVPYALKAGDAATVGGLPPSAFVQVTPTASPNASQSSSGAAAATLAAATAVLSPLSTVTTTGGTAKRIAMFTTATNIQNSVIVQSGSNVGIGTTAPAFTLQVEGSSSNGTGIQSVTTNRSTTTNSFAVVAATSTKGVTAEMVADGLGTGPLKTPSGYFGTFTNQPIGFIADNVERMRITSSGPVGIGTSTPAAWFEVTSKTFPNDAIHANGFNAPTGSNLSGTFGLVATGGNSDPMGNSGTGGTGVVGTGGNGVGVPSFDGPGGVFTGGNTSFNGDGVDGNAGSGYAGNFTGDVNVTGAIFAGTKDFKIDHPLDPANKYLVHASVESSEMMDIYTGNVTTDAQGDAIVHLPSWFEAVNTDFRYQLTVIGQFAQAIVAGKIQNHQFAIRTSAPNVEVSWQVTGVRQDAYAKAHPLVVEQEKDARLRGFYIHPELYGAPAERQIEWARHPQVMKKIQQERQQMKQKQARLATPAKP